MDRNEIIRMAREAGLLGKPTYIHGLEAFADLIVAVERERIIAANAPEIEAVNAYITELEDAVSAEREACAKVCESLFDMDDDSCNEAEQCAAAIRARGNHANG